MTRTKMPRSGSRLYQGTNQYTFARINTPRYTWCKDEDARQIAENVTGFFAILAEWSRPARLVPANDPTVPAPIDTAVVCHDR